jgi:hypothetical protein
MHGRRERGKLELRVWMRVVRDNLLGFVSGRDPCSRSSGNVLRTVTKCPPNDPEPR